MSESTGLKQESSLHSDDKIHHRQEGSCHRVVKQYYTDCLHYDRKQILQLGQDGLKSSSKRL